MIIICMSKTIKNDIDVNNENNNHDVNNENGNYKSANINNAMKAKLQFLTVAFEILINNLLICMLM